MRDPPRVHARGGSPASRRFRSRCRGENSQRDVPGAMPALPHLCTPLILHAANRCLAPHSVRRRTSGRHHEYRGLLFDVAPAAGCCCFAVIVAGQRDQPGTMNGSLDLGRPATIRYHEDVAKTREQSRIGHPLKPGGVFASLPLVNSQECDFLRQVSNVTSRRTTFRRSHDQP